MLSAGHDDVVDGIRHDAAVAVHMDLYSVIVVDIGVDHKWVAVVAMLAADDHMASDGHIAVIVAAVDTGRMVTVAAAAAAGADID